MQPQDEDTPVSIRNTVEITLTLVSDVGASSRSPGKSLTVDYGRRYYFRIIAIIQSR